MTDIISKNNLIQQASGVWCADRDPVTESFSYSDGDEEEIFLKRIISKAMDRSSLSKELEREIINWTSEYHLSSERANLLRGLDFSNAKTVIELGCGCGSISRYLGELNLEVDAIEGSLRRAEIARLRCAEFDNVRIINQNFNALKLPENTYDSTLLIGVLLRNVRPKLYCTDLSSGDENAVLASLGPFVNVVGPLDVDITLSRVGGHK